MREYTFEYSAIYDRDDNTYKGTIKTKAREITIAEEVVKATVKDTMQCDYVKVRLIGVQEELI